MPPLEEWEAIKTAKGLKLHHYTFKKIQYETQLQNSQVFLQCCGKWRKDKKIYQKPLWQDHFT
jgi:hypothetical protein